MYTLAFETNPVPTVLTAIQQLRNVVMASLDKPDVIAVAQQYRELLDLQALYDSYHERLGHVGHTAMVKAYQHDYDFNRHFSPELLKLMEHRTVKNCLGCLRGKARRHEHSRLAARASGVWHIDLTYYPATAKGEQYSVDAKHSDTGLSHVAILTRRRAEDFTPFLDELDVLSTAHGLAFREVRTAFDSEADNAAVKKWCRQHHKIHAFTQPYDSRAAGLIERHHQRLETIARSDAETHGFSFEKEWPLLIKLASHKHNRIPEKEKDKSPYEIVHGKAPDMTRMRAFGTPCHILVPPEKRNLRSDKTSPGIFVGLEEDNVESSLCYLVRMPDNTIRRSQEVYFTHTLKPAPEQVMQQLNQRELNAESESDDEPPELFSESDSDSDSDSEHSDDEPPDLVDSENEDSDSEDEDPENVTEAAPLASEGARTPRISPARSSGGGNRPTQRRGTRNRRPAVQKTDPLTGANTSSNVAETWRETYEAAPSSHWPNTPPSERAAARACPTEHITLPAYHESSRAQEQHYDYSAVARLMHAFTNGDVLTNEDEETTVDGNDIAALIAPYVTKDLRHLERSIAMHALVSEPPTIGAARQSEFSPEWIGAAVDEYIAVCKHGTWHLVPRTEATNLLKGKWVFKVKYNADGSVARFKARYVAKGFGQRPGVDYNETFAPVARIESIRAIIAMLTHLDWETGQLDVNTAFLNAPVSEDIYVEQPEDFEYEGVNGEQLVFKLDRALYGIKQAPREWALTLTAWMLANDFEQSKEDECVYIYLYEGQVYGIVAIYVDDLIITSPSKEWIAAFKVSMGETFDIKDLGELHWVLGIEVIRDRAKRTTELKQTSFIDKIIGNFGMADAKTRDVPLAPRTILKREDGTPPEQRSSAEFKQRLATYRSMVGSMLWPALCTRPDIAHTVSQLGRVMDCPAETHLDEARNALRYLKKTRDMGIIYRGGPDPTAPLELVVYADSDWNSDEECRSQYGVLTMFKGIGPISWCSKRMEMTTKSTTESELVAASEGTLETVYYRRLLAELGATQTKPTPQWEDNQSMLGRYLTAHPGTSGPSTSTRASSSRVSTCSTARWIHATARRMRCWPTSSPRR